MKRSLLPLVSVGAAASLLLGACAPQTSEAPQESAQVDLTDRKRFAGTTLRLLFKEGYEIAAIQAFEAEFEAETGINLEIEVYDEPTARQKLVLDAASPEGSYDITSGSFWNMPEFVKAGWLEPLDDYVNNKKDAWLEMSNIPTGALESMTINNQLYALPHTIIGGMFFHRTDVFEELGLTAPKTTQDVLALAKTLREQRPDLIPFSGRGAPTFASLGSILGWAHGYGALLFDEDGNPQANTPEMKQAVSDWVSLMKDYGASDAATLTFTQAGEKFSSGQAAMMFDTSGFGGLFENPTGSKVPGKIGFSQVQGPAGNNIQWLYMEGLAITANSQNKDAAWLFLQWRVSKETTMRELLEIGRTDVPNLAVLGSPEYADYMKKNNQEAFSVALQDSWRNAVAVHWPFYPEFALIGDTFAAEISSAIAGAKTVDQALEDAQVELTRIMKDAGYID
jgi:ABC-type glycerol-3-phosphate transport system substrate-binding protein